jgi:hypothetical protein
VQKLQVSLTVLHAKFALGEVTFQRKRVIGNVHLLQQNRDDFCRTELLKNTTVVTQR